MKEKEVLENSIDISGNYLRQEWQVFGRDNVLSLLNRRVADLKDGYRQNIALLGDAFVGKSAILLDFIRNLNDEKIVPIYLEVEDLDFSVFVNKYIGSLLYNFLKVKIKSGEENIEILQENARRFIPVTVEQIKKIRLNLEKGRALEVYRELIGLPETFFAETGIFCLVILDEFQNLEDFGLAFAFQELGKKIMLQRNCLYLVSSSQKLRAKKILSEKLSLLFGNFDLVDVPVFDVRKSQCFVNQNLGLALSNYHKNFLIDFTSGYPFYLRVICQELKKSSLLSSEKAILFETLLFALANLLFDKEGFFYLHFSLALQKIGALDSKVNPLAVLSAIANGQNKLKDISCGLGRGKAAVEQAIARLLESSVISKNGNFFYICDKLFVFWLKSVYQPAKNSFNYDQNLRRQGFIDLLAKLIEDFCQISQQKLASRVTELFYSFDNEYFQFNGHKYRLPIFKEIKPIAIERQNNQPLEAFLCRNAQMSWLVLLREEIVCEEEVSFFLEKTSKFNLKPDKKILIFVDDIEPNARLKALQEKIWLWNLNDFNLLMNFYHRPYYIK